MSQKPFLNLILSWIWIFILLTACEVGPDSNAPTKEQITPTAATAATASTATEGIKTITPASPSTIVSAPDRFEYKKICLSTSSAPVIYDTSGGLILNEVSSANTKGNVVLLDLSNHTTNQIFSEDEKINRIRVSPNKSLMAYQLIKNEGQNTNIQLVIRDFATDQIIKLPWDKDWSISGLRKWVNNQVLLIDKFSKEYPAPVTALNVFTNDKKTLPFNFPNQEIGSVDGDFSLPEYNPTLDYLIYPASDKGQFGYLLEEVASQETIAFIPTQTLMTFSSPAWSNSGNTYILSIIPFDDQSNKFELVYGDTSGKVTQITNLGDYIESYYIHNIIWSPDDRYVAFVVRNTTDINNQVDTLMILDMTNRELLDLCVDMNYANWRGDFADVDFPTWSPDSRELIVENQFAYGKNNVILIDLLTMTASIIEKDKKVLWWVTLE
jgi:hypothetical protein